MNPRINSQNRENFAEIVQNILDKQVLQDIDVLSFLVNKLPIYGFGIGVHEFRVYRWGFAG